MPLERIPVLVPARLWDEQGNEFHAELRLVADDDDQANLDQLDCRLVRTDVMGGDDWILNVDRPTLLRALDIVGAEREAVPSDG